MPAGVNTEPHLHPTERSRLQIVPLVIWSAVVFLVVAATILMANDQRNFRLLTDFVLGPPSAVYPEPTPEAPSQSLETSPDRSLLLEMPVNDTIPLVRLASAKDRCKSLTLAKQELPVYTETNGFSQCTLLYKVGESQTSQSIFVQIQTDQTGMVTSFRLKFNTEGKPADIIVSKGLEFLETFGGLFLKTEEFIAVISHRIGTWERFQMVLGPYMVEMDRELINPTRFNVLGRTYATKTFVDDPWRAAQGSTFRN